MGGLISRQISSDFWVVQLETNPVKAPAFLKTEDVIEIRIPDSSVQDSESLDVSSSSLCTGSNKKQIYPIKFFDVPKDVICRL